jgi:hypothetical protein
MTDYLTEENLGKILKQIKPHNHFVHDKSVPGSTNKRLRPDYRNDELELILEFDGDSHYCKANRIIKDKIKDEDYIQLGYKVFRIPYFIQMNSNLLKMIFNEDINFKQVYPNGFIDKKAILPADFCEKGIELFISDLEKFSYCKNEIINSLKRKIEELENIELVLPKSLYYLVN